MKKQYEERLDELEARLGELGSVDAERDQLKVVADDISESVERRLTQMKDHVLQETDDKIQQLEQVHFAINPLGMFRIVVSDYSAEYEYEYE